MPSNASTASAGDTFLLRLYGCCANASGWHGVLDQFCTEMGVGSAVLQELRLERPYAETIWMAHDSRSDLTAYEATISDAGNPRLEGKRFPAALGRLVGDEDLFADDEYPIRRRLQEQLAALGFGRFLGGLVGLGENRYMALALHREVSDKGDFSDRQRDRLWALLPHFAQALQLGQSHASNRSAEALVRGHLDRWRCGLIVCDVVGRVQWLNQRARSELRDCDGLRLSEGALHAPGADARRQLREALRRQADSGVPSFLALDLSGRRWQLALETLEQSGADGGPLLLVALTGDQPAGAIPVESLVALFGLTEAESRLTSALVAGMSLEEYARRRGVGLGTVRYQLKQVLAKTGAHRQADLVRKVLCSAAAHVAGGPARTGSESTLSG